MLKISMVPIMTRMIAKLDLTAAIDQLKTLDIFESGQKNISAEQAGILAFEIISGLTPQLDKIGKDIPEFVALYKGISIEDANLLDLAEVVADLKNDEGILNFFKRALRQKAEHAQ